MRIESYLNGLNGFGYCYVVKIIDVSGNRDNATSFAFTTMKVYLRHNRRRSERYNKMTEICSTRKNGITFTSRSGLMDWDE